MSARHAVLAALCERRGIAADEGRKRFVRDRLACQSDDLLAFILAKWPFSMSLFRDLTEGELVSVRISVARAASLIDTESEIATLRRKIERLEASRDAYKHAIKSGAPARLEAVA